MACVAGSSGSSPTVHQFASGPFESSNTTRHANELTAVLSDPLGLTAHRKQSWTRTLRLSSRKKAPSPRVWIPSAHASPCQAATPELPQRLFASLISKRHSAADSEKSSAHDSFDLIDDAHRPEKNVARPKHIAITIPERYSYVLPEPSDSSEPRPAAAFSFRSSQTLNFFKGLPKSLFELESSCPRSTLQHEAVKIPEYAEPLRLATKKPQSERSQDCASLKRKEPHAPSVALDSPVRPSKPTMDPGSHTQASYNRLYANESRNGSGANLSGAYGSQVSLSGMRSDYESASEAESSHEDGLASHAHSHSQALSTSDLQMPVRPHTATSSNLSGLVCNAHRTTGREPRPTVGATTTVLGDKLYVFGGRRFSQTKQQFTASLYELDLVTRHWVKVEHKGDVPSPRYFHSVCALGDTKLVCYGGMSPTQIPEVILETGHPEVKVMSDIHIYDVFSRTWTQVSTPDAPEGRYAHCATILPSSAIFASQSAPMSAVHHNPQGNHPNQGTLGVALDGAGGAEMIVVGGQDRENHYIDQASIFNFRSLKWTNTTSMGRSYGAYRSMITPLTSMSGRQIGAGPHATNDYDDDDEEPASIGSGAPMLIYSNHNFLDVKLELQVRLTDGTFEEKTMQTAVSPPGLRFPNGGVIDNHLVVSGTFLTSSKQEYALWALDLRTLAWSKIDAGGSLFSQGSWNRGVLWNQRNAFVILGNRKRNLVDDYNSRRINFANICIVELEAFGLYENPVRSNLSSNFKSASAPWVRTPSEPSFGRLLSSAAEDLGALALDIRELSDMDFLAVDGTRVPVNSRLIARRWGPHFVTLLRESLISAHDTDTATLRPSIANHPSRNSSVTITPSVDSNATTLTQNTNTSVPDTRTAPPTIRPRLFYLPHTAPTLHALLHYLYTSTLPLPPSPLATPQIFCSLLQLARPYKIDGLLEAVIESLHLCLDGRNAAAIFNAAAMGAGGNDSLSTGSPSASTTSSTRQSEIPTRTASLAGLDSLMANGSAEGRITARNTLRPRPLDTPNSDTDTDDDTTAHPSSRSAADPNSDVELTLGGGSASPHRPRTNDPRHDSDAWTGSLSAVVGLQKRGLRGLMEGRRMRERRTDASIDRGGRVGLGIA